MIRQISRAALFAVVLVCQPLLADQMFDEMLASAQKGNPIMQVKVAELYQSGEGGVTQSSTDAAEWYQKAAAQGYAVAQYNLGVMYGEGKGVDQNYEEAFTWFEKAAEQGYVAAQYNLGLMYDQGRGVFPDIKEAISWYTRAAEQGDEAAQYNLGVIYAEGKEVPQDYSEAVLWYTKAAEQGATDAQYNLGLIYYEQGDGFEPDYRKAYIWFAIAANGGNSDAVIYREKAAARLAPGQLEAARQDVANLGRRLEPKQPSKP